MAWQHVRGRHDGTTVDLLSAQSGKDYGPIVFPPVFFTLLINQL